MEKRPILALLGLLAAAPLWPMPTRGRMKKALSIILIARTGRNAHRILPRPNTGDLSATHKRSPGSHRKRR